MTRESYRQKGERYLIHGRITITSLGPEIVTATARGTGEIHHVTATADGWRCTCPAKGPCCHIWATQLVVLKPPRAPS